MIDLLLAVACSLAIGMIFKHAGLRGMDRLSLLTANYAAAMAMGAVLLTLGAREAAGGLAPSLPLAALGVTTGALFIFGFFMLSLATEVAGMSLAVGVMRVSVVIPFLASWVIWDEVPSAAQGLGLALAGAAFFMIAKKGQSDGAAAAPPIEHAQAAASVQPAEHVQADREAVSVTETVEMKPAEATSSARVFVVLAVLFVAGGTVDVLMKTFDEAFAATNSRALFLLMLFGVAFLIGLGLVLWRGAREGRWPRGRTLGWGVALGVVNYGSVEFILRAIRALSGPFVFPANNIAIVIGAALLGVYFWGEHLSRLNWAGLGLAAVALFLLNL